MKNEMKLEELEQVNGGYILNDIVDEVKKIKDAIEERIKNTPRPIIANAAE